MTEGWAGWLCGKVKWPPCTAPHYEQVNLTVHSPLLWNEEAKYKQNQFLSYAWKKGMTNQAPPDHLTKPLQKHIGCIGS